MHSCSELAHAVEIALSSQPTLACKVLARHEGVTCTQGKAFVDRTNECMNKQLNKQLGKQSNEQKNE